MVMRLGIDLGGTKTEIVAMGDGGEILKRHRIATPQGDYQAGIKTIASLIETIENELGMQGSIGIATPGAISPASGLM